jgi:hypothetical protein
MRQTIPIYHPNARNPTTLNEFLEEETVLLDYEFSICSNRYMTLPSLC